MQPGLKYDPSPVQEDRQGVLRVADSRVTLDALVDLYDQGATADEIALAFESLQLHQVYAALGWYLANRPVLDDYLRSQAIARESARTEAERRCPPTALRTGLALRLRQRNDAPTPG
jgi:uncharacterized protein (DUF433 family)